MNPEDTFHRLQRIPVDQMRDLLRQFAFDVIDGAGDRTISYRDNRRILLQQHHWDPDEYDEQVGLLFP